ncbi:unnamed protein product [Paramecium primaurelia]|uniref:Uncharacterized protein n=1 Tax=Paramecium primaurelia TaxID=5886 RepID=A0A8S1QCH0_PARPR|nr:unnamed protein product [Paramecium primaurelia]
MLKPQLILWVEQYTFKDKILKVIKEFWNNTQNYFQQNRKKIRFSIRRKQTIYKQ